MSFDPLRMFREPFSVDVTTSGVQVQGLAPQPVTFGSIEIGAGPSRPSSPAPAAPVAQPSGGQSAVAQGGQMTFAPPSAPANAPVAGVWDMAASFGTSVAKYAAGGFKTVSEEIHRERMAQCNSCSHHTGTRCVLCGCFTHAKAWMPHESCPLLKWLAVQPGAAS